MTEFFSQKLEPQPEEDKMLEADPQETLDNESLPAPIRGLEKFSRNFLFISWS